MSLTSSSDIYSAVHEEGINLIIRHIMLQRPSLFNYGTSLIVNNPRLLCEPIEVAPGITTLITEMDPLPVVGTYGVGLNYCFQITDMETDFHPGSVFTLPPELNPPLSSQEFAFLVRICVGMGCPPRGYLKEVDLPPEYLVPFERLPQTGEERERPRDLPPIVLPTRELECFCIELFITGTSDIVGPVGSQEIRIALEEPEIVDIKPMGMENSMECYMNTVIQLVVIPRVNKAITKILFETIDLGDLGSINISASTSVPNNPAIEDHQMKVFIDIDSVTLTPVVSGNGDGPPPPPITRTTRSRTRTGPAHFTAALSEGAFSTLFEAIRAGFVYENADSVTLGWLTAGYDVKLHLDDGSVEFNPDGTIEVSELDIIWDRLQGIFGINIPGFCVGGGCADILGWEVCLPEYCVFDGNPDISFTLDLAGIFITEVSLIASLKVYYGLDAPNRWQVFLDPVLPIDVDIVDIEPTIINLWENAVEDAMEALLSSLGLPGWAVNLILDHVGDAVEFIAGLLDIPDDVGEWLSEEILGFNLNLFNLIAAAIVDYFADDQPLFELEDPFEILPASGTLNPVKIPIEFLGIDVDDNEMTVIGDVGA
jgi:hypothetical protein